MLEKGDIFYLKDAEFIVMVNETREQCAVCQCTYSNTYYKTGDVYHFEQNDSLSIGHHPNNANVETTDTRKEFIELIRSLDISLIDKDKIYKLFGIILNDNRFNTEVNLIKKLANIISNGK